MKKLLITFLALSLLGCQVYKSYKKEGCCSSAGVGYLQSVNASLLAGKYRNGDPDWDRENEEWLNSDDDTPYPEDLKDIDGDGYRDSQRVVEDLIAYKPGEGYVDSETAVDDAGSIDLVDDNS